MNDTRYGYSKAKVNFADKVGLVYLNLVTESYFGPNQQAAPEKDNKAGSSFWGSGSSSGNTKV